MQLDSYYGDNSLHKYPYNGERTLYDNVLRLKTEECLLSLCSDGTERLQQWVFKVNYLSYVMGYVKGWHGYINSRFRLSVGIFNISIVHK